MKFFETIARGLGDQSAKEGSSEVEMERSHVSTLVDRLGRDDATNVQFDNEVRARSSASDELEETADGEDDMMDEAANEAVEGGLPESISLRRSDFLAFNEVAGEIERQFQSFSDNIAAARRTWSSAQPYIGKFDVDIRRMDEVEKDRDGLVEKVASLSRSEERTARNLALKIGELDAANARNTELRAEVDQRRQTALELTSKLNHVRQELANMTSVISYYRADIAKLTADLERETGTKETAEHSFIELSGKYARLQQVEAQTRNKAMETGIQNEKLLAQLPLLVAEQENRQNELRSVNRERGDLQIRLTASQDQILQLESEIQALQSQAASESYTSRTELEMSQSDLRAAERSYADAEARLKDAFKQIRELEARRQTNEFEIASQQRELETARKEYSILSVKVSDLNLKYMADLVTLEQERDMNVELHRNVEALLTENRRMSKFEALYKQSQAQVAGLMGRLSLLTESAEDGSLEEMLGRDYLGDSAASQLVAVNDPVASPAPTPSTASAQ